MPGNVHVRFWSRGAGATPSPRLTLLGLMGTVPQNRMYT